MDFEFDIISFKNIDLTIKNKNNIDEINEKINLLNEKKDYLNDILFKGRYEKKVLVYEENKPKLIPASAPLDYSQKKQVNEIINYYNSKIEYFKMEINSLKDKKAKASNEIKEAFKKYENQNDPYDFSDYFFDKDVFVLEFSKLISKNEIKLLYLEYCRDRIEVLVNIKDFSAPLIAEINKLKKIIEMDTILKIDPVMKKNIGSISKIKWFGTESQLEYLIESFKKEKWITEHNTFSLINNHFEKSSGKEFNFSQAKQNRENSKTGKPKKSYIIDNIIESAKMKK